MEANMSVRKLTRREFIKVSAVGLLGAVMPALSEPDPSAASSVTTTNDPTWLAPGEIAQPGRQSGASRKEAD